MTPTLHYNLGASCSRRGASHWWSCLHYHGETGGWGKWHSTNYSLAWSTISQLVYTLHRIVSLLSEDPTVTAFQLHAQHSATELSRYPLCNVSSQDSLMGNFWGVHMHDIARTAEAQLSTILWLQFASPLIYMFDHWQYSSALWLLSLNIAGLGNIHLLTQVNSKLSIFLEAHDGETRTANYSTFKVAAGTVNYQLNVRQ